MRFTCFFSLTIIFSLLASPLFASPVPTVSARRGDSECATYSPAIFNLGTFAVNDAAFKNTFSIVTDDSFTFYFNLPRLIERLRTYPSAARGFNESDVAAVMLFNIKMSVPAKQFSAALKESVRKLEAYGLKTPKVWQTLRRLILETYDEASKEPRFNSYNDLNVNIRGVRLPKASQDLLALARDMRDPLGVFAEAQVVEILELQGRSGLLQSLNNAGWVHLNRNRIFQDLRYLGYSCASAKRLIRNIPKQFATSRALTASVTTNGITYQSGTSQLHFSALWREPLEPQLFYQASFPLDPQTVPDFTQRYQGQYQSTDFAIGAFDDVHMKLSDPLYLVPALNLMRAFPDRKFTFEYSPDTAALFGIADFPSHVRSYLTQSHLTPDNVYFRINTTPISETGHWTRDQWLYAKDLENNTIVRLRGSDGAEQADDFKAVDISTVGGAHYPIGKYLFLSGEVWKPLLPEVTEDAIAHIRERYLERVGREPILMNVGTETHGFNDHVDLYLIFLPQPNGKPAIGVADISLGKRILREQKLDNLMRDIYLYRQMNLRTQPLEKAQINAGERTMSGMPLFSKLSSLRFNRDHFIFQAMSYFGDAQQTLDAEAEWLRAQGFTVFRFPFANGLSQANGISELSEKGAVFTTVTWGVRAFDAELARIIGEFGYSLRLMPGNAGIEEGAGYHCLTNEARFAGNY